MYIFQNKLLVMTWLRICASISTTYTRLEHGENFEALENKPQV